MTVSSAQRRHEIIHREFGAAAAPAIEAMIRDFEPLNVISNPVMAAFYGNTRGLRQSAIDFFIKRHGVPVLALARDGDGFGAALAETLIEIDRDRFDFRDPQQGEAATRALAIVARDEIGHPIDIVAWVPEEDRAASHFGRCVILGAHDVDAPRCADPLPVHRDVLSWLRADRRGVVIIDTARAWRPLEGVELVADDVEHGRHLRKILTAPPPRILVQRLEAA